MGSLELIPQAINTITILATDSLTNINSSVDSTYKFMIGITIDDYGMEIYIIIINRKCQPKHTTYSSIVKID
jgi:hypothetical protein